MRRNRIYAAVLALLFAGTLHADLPDPQLMRPVLLHEDAQVSVFARCPTQKVLPDEDLAEALSELENNFRRMDEQIDEMASVRVEMQDAIVRLEGNGE